MVNSGLVKHASLGGVWGSPQNFFEKVSALRLRFGNQALTTVVIAPVPVYCLSTAPCVGNYDIEFWGGEF